MKKILAALFAVLLWCPAKAQEDLGPIKWLTFEEAEKLDSAENRPFLIDVYTDWCGWCKRMMATTFHNRQLASYINQNFYCVRFDAETQDTIQFLVRHGSLTVITTVLQDIFLATECLIPQSFTWTSKNTSLPCRDIWKSKA